MRLPYQARKDRGLSAMNVKELKNFLGNFPDDAEIIVEANNHYSDLDEGITNASLVELKDKMQVLIFGNSSQADRKHDGCYEHDGYNLGEKRYLKTWNEDNGLKTYND
jgi:hypothetical protein